MRKRVRFVGRVQGVGFRATARSIAERLPLTGWVRNDIDGSVEMEAQGDIHTIAALLDEIRQVFGGKIVGVDEHAIDEVSGESGFVIRR